MIPTDKSEFCNFMKSIFVDEWQASLSAEKLSRWFRTFESYNLDRFKKAVGEYLCDSRQGKFPPKEGQILEIIKTIPFDTHSVRCTWQNCRGFGSERLGNYFYCREHCDEMILKNEPDSIQAEVIRGARKFMLEAKELGITSREYFEKVEPEFFKSIQKMRVENKAEVAERKIIRAIGDLYETPIGKEERERILGKMENTARYYRQQTENAEKMLSA